MYAEASKIGRSNARRCRTTNVLVTVNPNMSTTTAQPRSIEMNDQDDLPPGGMKQDALVFARLLEQNRSRVFGYLLAIVQNFSDAEDLYQQTALVLWEKFSQFQLGTDFGSWATSTAHFHAMNFLRGRSRRRNLFSEAALERLAAAGSQLNSVELDRRSNALDFCLETLSHRQRRLLEMRFHGDRSLQDIAVAERRTVAAVSMALTRIRKSLLACIERRVALEAR
jgi:RNA polymerase sigma-70 factor, ECF subfamily